MIFKREIARAYSWILFVRIFCALRRSPRARGASLRVRLVIIHTSRKEKVFSVLFLLLVSRFAGGGGGIISSFKIFFFLFLGVCFPFCVRSREAHARERLLSYLVFYYYILSLKKSKN